MMNITTSKWRFLKILPPPLSSMSDWEFSWNKSSILGYFHLWNPHGGGNLMEFANLGKPGAWALPQSWPWGARVVKNICFWIHIYIYSIDFNCVFQARLKQMIKKNNINAGYLRVALITHLYVNRQFQDWKCWTQSIHTVHLSPWGYSIRRDGSYGAFGGILQGGPPNHPSHVFSFTGKHGGKKQHFEKHTWWI